MLIVLFALACVLAACEETSFEYIVVGSGPAGSIVARRLYDAGFSVILIEAGRTTSASVDGGSALFPFRSPLTGFDSQLLRDVNRAVYSSEVQWNGHTAAKLFGGGSSFNGGSFQRGTSADFDQMWNATGWGWSDVLPFYKKLETARTSSPDPSSRGFNGPVTVTDVQSWGPFPWDLVMPLVVQCANSSGVPFLPDYSAQDAGVGIGYNQFSVDLRGLRQNPAHSYIGSIRQEVNISHTRHPSDPYSNSWATSQPLGPTTRTLPQGPHEGKQLFVMLQAMVTRVLMSDHGPPYTALGVEINDTSTNTLRTVLARREVILSAGCLRSPLILVHSGIGPASVLRGLNVTVRIINEELGRNVDDHFGVMALNYAHHPSVPEFYPTQENDRLRAWIQGDGSRQLDGRMQLRFKTVPGLAKPDMMAQCGGFGYGQIVVDGKRVMQCRIVMWNTTSSLGRPRGFFQWSHTPQNPYLSPTVNQNFYNEHEVDRVVSFITQMRATFLRNTTECAAVFTEEWPNLGSGEVLRNTVRTAVQRGGTYLHFTGSAAIGRVVDNRLRVMGTTNLRVCDAGAMSTTPAGHMTNNVMMVGERGAALIIEDALQEAQNR